MTWYALNQRSSCAFRWNSAATDADCRHLHTPSSTGQTQQGSTIELASADYDRNIARRTFSLYKNLFSSPSFALIGLLPCCSTPLVTPAFQGPAGYWCVKASNNASINCGAAEFSKPAALLKLFHQYKCKMLLLIDLFFQPMFKASGCFSICLSLWGKSTLAKNLPKIPEGFAACPFSLPGILPLQFTRELAALLTLSTYAS